MAASFMLAFVITPAIVVAVAWAGVLLHEWDLRRSRDRSAE
jgi:hypothetical protein